MVNIASRFLNCTYEFICGLKARKCFVLIFEYLKVLVLFSCYTLKWSRSNTNTSYLTTLPSLHIYFILDCGSVLAASIANIHLRLQNYKSYYKILVYSYDDLFSKQLFWE